MKEKIFDRFVELIAEKSGYWVEEFFGSEKVDLDMTPYKHMLYLLCHDRNMGSSEIAKYMQKNGSTARHSGVIKGIRSIKKRIKIDPDYMNIYKEIKNSVD